MATHVERVVSLGDSLMLGLGTQHREGWVQMLHRHYVELNTDLGRASRTPRIFYELGVFATKAQDLAESIAVETEKRLWLPGENDEYDRTKRLSIVSIGVNDSWLRARDGQHVTPMEEFSRHIGMAATILAERSQILYVGLLPPDEAACDRFWGTPTPPQLESRIAYEREAARIFQDEVPE